MHQLCYEYPWCPHYTGVLQLLKNWEVWKHCWTHFGFENCGTAFYSGRAETDACWLDLFAHDIAFPDWSGCYYMTPFQKKTTSISLDYEYRILHFTMIRLFRRQAFIWKNVVCNLALSATNNQMLPVYTSTCMPGVCEWRLWLRGRAVGLQPEGRRFSFPICMPKCPWARHWTPKMAPHRCWMH